MSNYTKATNFTAKDTTNATILGAEHDAEYDAIAAASATKANKKVPATANSLAGLDSNGDLRDTAVTEAALATAIALGTTNQTNIATNTTNIATNTTNIGTNTTNIATNTSDIATLQSDMTTAQGNITTLQNEYTRVTGVTVGTSTFISQALTGTVERIEIAFHGLSMDAAGQPMIQLGTGAVLTATGYVAQCADSGNAVSYTTGIGLTSRGGAAAYTYSGVVILTNCGGNRWSASGNIYSDFPKVGSAAGYVTLAGACDIVGLVAGTGNFDAGYWSVTYWRSA